MTAPGQKGPFSDPIGWKPEISPARVVSEVFGRLRCLTVKVKPWKHVDLDWWMQGSVLPSLPLPFPCIFSDLWSLPGQDWDNPVPETNRWWLPLVIFRWCWVWWDVWMTLWCWAEWILSLPPLKVESRGRFSQIHYNYHSDFDNSVLILLLWDYNYDSQWILIITIMILMMIFSEKMWRNWCDP